MFLIALSVLKNLPKIYKFSVFYYYMATRFALILRFISFLVSQLFMKFENEEGDFGPSLGL